MRWIAYINTPVDDGVSTSREVLDISNTTRSDGSFVTLEASKKFNIKEDYILCIPCCNIKCEENNHTKKCEELFNLKVDPIFISN